jgi:hypothetical protein
VKISAHQPDFLPYSGFWYKLANSELMDLRIHAQIVKRPGYQRRVKMRDDWVNVVLAEGQGFFDPISEVRIDNKATRSFIINRMRGRYGGSPFFKQRMDDLCDAINEQTSSLLWQFNLGLLMYVRDEVLGIKTPFTISQPSQGTKVEGLLSYLSLYPHLDTYLAGPGAKKYMADTAPFDEVGIKVEWSRHKPVTGDSIVTLMMDYEDPMEMVLQEHPEGGQE